MDIDKIFEHCESNNEYCEIDGESCIFLDKQEDGKCLFSPSPKDRNYDEIKKRYNELFKEDK